MDLFEESDEGCHLVLSLLVSRHAVLGCQGLGYITSVQSAEVTQLVPINSNMTWGLGVRVLVLSLLVSCHAVLGCESDCT